MPWRTRFFAASMPLLSAPAREKAIEIANALLEDGIAKGKAIVIAITQVLGAQPRAADLGQRMNPPVRERTNRAAYTIKHRIDPGRQ